MSQYSKNISTFDLDAAVERFENEWTVTGTARLEDFLPPLVDPGFSTILCELIRVELEIRWKRGQQPLVEEYLQRFSALEFSAADVEHMAFEEYRIRYQVNSVESRETFAQRLGINTSHWPDWPQSDFNDQSQEIGTRKSSSTSRLKIEFPTVGSRFHGFDIVGQLGKGAFGRVYLARQESLANRFVAVKVTEVSDTEPQSLARLQHTNIIPIYSLKKKGTLQSICMPFLGVATLQDLFQLSSRDKSSELSGRDLISTVAGKRASTIAATVSQINTPEFQNAIIRGNHHGDAMPAIAGLSYQQTAVWMAGRVADGLAYAHSRGVVHGDLKPANILISDDGEPLILDFHLANAGIESKTETLVGGTLPYMSARHLQCLRGEKEVDASCDIFSLGVVLYESLTGILPFENRGNDEVALDQMIHDRQTQPIPIRRHNTALSVDMESIVAHCLAPETKDRYRSARELQSDIDRHLANLPLMYAPNRSSRERIEKWVKRHPKLSSGTTIAMFSLLALAAMVALIASRLTHAAQLETENQSRLLTDSVKIARLPLALRSDQNLNFMDSIDHASRVIDNRTAGGVERYRALLADLPVELREHEVRELGATNYWIAYRLLRDAETRPDPIEREKEFAAAIERLDFVLAVAEEKTPTPILQMKASVLESQGNFDGASQLLHSIAQDQRFATVPERLLQAAELRRNHQDQESIAALQTLTGEQPDIAEAWLMMGQAYSRLKEFGKADVCYTIEIENAVGSSFSGLDCRLVGVDVGGPQGPKFTDPLESPFVKNENGEYVYPDDVVTDDTFVIVDGISTNQNSPPIDLPPTNFFNWYWGFGA